MSLTNDDVYSNECTPSGSQSLEEVDSISLDAKAAKDDALWTDAHSSDDEEFDPANPHDLSTATAKTDKAAESGDSDESDDSIVCDEVESACPSHKQCIEFSAELDAFILRTFTAKSGGKERRAALVEVLCDHFEAGAQ